MNGEICESNSQQGRQGRRVAGDGWRRSGGRRHARGRRSAHPGLGVAAGGFIHINPVAKATFFNTPAVSSAFVYPGFITTGGILDRASGNQAYSQVGSPKVYLFSQVDQLNADRPRPPAGSVSSARR